MTQCSTTTHARFLLLGDSHAGPIGRAADAAGLPFSGGPIGSGREFNADFFEFRGQDLLFCNAEAEAHYRTFLAELGVSGLAEVTVPLVSTFGFSAHVVATIENWQIYRRQGEFLPGFLTSSLFAAIVLAMIRDALAFYRHALALGLRVLAVLPPQRVPAMADPAVFLAAQEVVRTSLAGLGAEIVDLRAKATDQSGFQRPELCERDDPIHGNLAFGRLILTDLLARGL